MSGSTGDIFWDLPPSITYNPGFDIGCSIYVANPTETEKEYALMARLYRGETLLSEEAVPVFGYAWFKVAPQDFIRLRGALRFSESDADLAVMLVERETEEVADTAVTRLVAPQAAGSLPPSWPGSPGGAQTGFNWSSLLTTMLPALMLGVVIGAGRPSEERDAGRAKTSGETKALPEGRTD
jgi:hypothetical protein